MSQLRLQDLVEEAGITTEQLDVPCPEEKLLELVDFCNPWNIVGLHLKLKQTLIDDIDRDCRTTEEKRIKTLQKWKEAFAFKATYRAFVEALMTCGRVFPALELCKHLAGTPKPPKPEPIPPAATSRKPTMQEAFLALMLVASHWKDIGTALGLQDGWLNNIDADHRNATSCLREMLSHWLRQVDPEPTIKALATAVRPFSPEKARELEALDD